MPLAAEDHQPGASGITVVGVAYWASHTSQLVALLHTAARGGRRSVADPTGDTNAIAACVVDPAYWADQPLEIADAFRRATTDLAVLRTPPDRDSGLASGAAAGQERLTLTVEEAATALGISRASAYDAVSRGDIPHIRIGRRILVPRSALTRLLDSAGGQPSAD